MNDKLKQLYQSVILEHSNHPVHYEKREGSTYTLDAYNPLCGDRFSLYFDVEDGKIRNLCFYGYGCAISKASTSVLAKRLEGKSLTEAAALCQAFAAVVQPAAPLPAEVDEEFEAFAAAREFPGRIKCAALSWEEMETFLALKG